MAYRHGVYNVEQPTSMPTPQDPGRPRGNTSHNRHSADTPCKRPGRRSEQAHSLQQL